MTCEQCSGPGDDNARHTRRISRAMTSAFHSSLVSLYLRRSSKSGLLKKMSSGYIGQEIVY